MVKKNGIILKNIFWKNKKVLITGHTGFKGSWLSLWLHKKGAKVYGYALESNTESSLFEDLNLKNLISHKIGDIMDYKKLKQYVQKISPDIIFHLAAQSIVSTAYKNPLDTWNVNVMGTSNLLNSLTQIKNTCAVIIVTSDKVYSQKGNKKKEFSENDRLGGYDPYSSSKVAAEIAVESWNHSFYLSKDNIKISTVRAGNVVGGGDWGNNRLLPDIFRAKEKNVSITIRNPAHIRPWQHVLDCLNGYIILAEKNYNDKNYILESFNFGPEKNEIFNVEQLLIEVNKYCNIDYVIDKKNNFYESPFLFLNIEKSKSILDWKPKWDFNTTIKMTVEWYTARNQSNNMLLKSINQIKYFEKTL